jgi:hypothetical protein
VVYDSLLGMIPHFFPLCREFLLFLMKALASGGQKWGSAWFSRPRTGCPGIHVGIRSRLGY